MTAPQVPEEQIARLLPATLQPIAGEIARALALEETGDLSAERVALLQLARPYLDPAIRTGDIRGNIGVAIGENASADVRIYLGPGYPRPDYLGEISSRIDYYAEHFVGRAGELARLMRPRSDGEPGYTLVEAAGGLGKSALIAQLFHRWRTATWAGVRPRLIVFFVRKETGEHTPEYFLQRVNAQLLEILEHEGGVPGDIESLRSQFSQLWAAATARATAQVPLVLLVDGLDEMQRGTVTIARVLPEKVPAHVQVIVTSRPNPRVPTLVPATHALRRPARITLSNLGLDEIQQLLALSGVAPEPALRLAQEILTLTRGEPLFVRFVSEEAAAEGRIPPVLASQPPADVQEYFKTQFDLLNSDASGAQARDVLGVLAVARGGLSAADLASILDAEPNDVNAAVTLIGRFLIGAERYELMHAELRKAVRASFSSRRLAAMASQIVAWCASHGPAWARPVPAYVLEQYARHLKEAGDDAALWSLMTNADFRLAQREAFGDIGQTLDDVRLALETALAADVIASIIACAGAYRDTLRHGRLTETLFQALDAGDEAQVLRRAAVCGTERDWAHILWAYLAWEAALARDAARAQRALASISGVLDGPLAEVYDALLVRAARALEGLDSRDAGTWLASWGRTSDAAALLERYPVADSIPYGAETPDLPNLRALANYMAQEAMADAESGLYDA